MNTAVIGGKKCIGLVQLRTRGRKLKISSSLMCQILEVGSSWLQKQVTARSGFVLSAGNTFTNLLRLLMGTLYYSSSGNVLNW